MIKIDHRGRKFNFERRRLGCGYIYPYHGKKPVDTAEAIALGILYDLSDRGGIKHELGAICAAVRVDIVTELADIIREGMSARPPAIDDYDALMDHLVAETPQ